MVSLDSIWYVIGITRTMESTFKLRISARLIKTRLSGSPRFRLNSILKLIDQFLEAMAALQSRPHQGSMNQALKHR
jgi:hypothetical protein